MFKELLVPLDGSDIAETALATASNCMEEGGTLHLVRVLETLQLSGWLPIDLVAAHQQERRVAEEYLKELSAKYSDHPFQVKTHVPEGPNPDEGVVSVAEAEQVQAILLSSHGRTGASRLLLGSVAEKIMRQAEVPVLVLKQGSLELKNQRILVPLDGSPLAEEALVFAQSLVASGGGVVLLGVSTLSPFITPDDGELTKVVEGDLERIRGYLGERAAQLSASGVEVTTRALHGQATETIVDVAKQENADLIVLASHGRTGVRRMVLGSVAEGVVRGAECPVGVVRGQMS